MLPRSPFKTEAQIAEEKSQAEFKARWNHIEPQPGERVPQVPKKDARLMSPQELTAAWGNVRRGLKPCDAPSCVEKSRQPGAQEARVAPTAPAFPRCRFRRNQEHFFPAAALPWVAGIGDSPRLTNAPRRSPVRERRAAAASRHSTFNRIIKFTKERNYEHPHRRNAETFGRRPNGRRARRS